MQKLKGTHKATYPTGLSQSAKKQKSCLANMEFKIELMDLILSHLLHFGYHVTIDDIHAGGRHPHQYFNHHLSL